MGRGSLAKRLRLLCIRYNPFYSKSMDYLFYRKYHKKEFPRCIVLIDKDYMTSHPTHKMRIVNVAFVYGTFKSKIELYTIHYESYSKIRNHMRERKCLTSRSKRLMESFHSLFAHLGYKEEISHYGITKIYSNKIWMRK